MNIEFSKEELELIQILLTHEENDTNIEIRHSDNFEYKEFLAKRQRIVQEMLNRIESMVAVGTA